MWTTRLRRTIRRWTRPAASARVPKCRCAGACRCAGLVPYLLHRELELETEFFRGVM